MGGDGFEPSKAKPADLQSAPFGHSGIRPRVFDSMFFFFNRQHGKQKNIFKTKADNYFLK